MPELWKTRSGCGSEVGGGGRWQLWIPRDSFFVTPASSVSHPAPWVKTCLEWLQESPCGTWNFHNDINGKLGKEKNIEDGG